MKGLSPRIIILLAIVAAVGVVALAQDSPPPDDAAQFAQQRPNLLEGLGLSQDQVRQIRIMNRDRKPKMDAAQRRLREAEHALSLAIYGDAVDDQEVEARLKEFQQAQAGVASIRFRSELELRKILTPDQLTKFRAMRARMAQTRRDAQERRQLRRGERPLQRIRQLPGRQRVN
jgi:Spy/CpxP family protein refolding chaperone